MPTAKYRVALTEAERGGLQGLLRRGACSARTNTRARILLKADEGRNDAEVAEALACGVATVGRVRKRFAEAGLERALHERPRPGQARKLSGPQEAHLIALTCSAAPAGVARWTLRLLAGKVVELGLAESISHETVRRVLKKTSSSPGRSASGVSRR